MKTKSIDAQLWKDTVSMLSMLITFATYMTKPTPEKEKLLTEARVIWVKAKKADLEEPG